MSLPEQVLFFLIDNLSSASHCFLNCLSVNDLVRLSLLNKRMYILTLTEYPHIYNRIFYHSRLLFDKGSEQLEFIGLLCSSSLNFKPHITNTIKLRKQLYSNISAINPDLQIHRIVCQLNNTFKQPSLPLPKLRRDSVGIYCRSAFQFMQIQQHHYGSDDYQPEQHFQQLQEALIEQEKMHTDFFVQNPDLIKEIRYRPEMLSVYTPTNCCFVNIVMLVMLIIQNHLQAVQNIIRILPYHQAFKQFVIRYEVFKNTVLELEEKIGFIFKHFDAAFCYTFHEYSNQPTFSLWKIALKKWIRVMCCFHNQNSRMCAYLLSILMDAKMNQILNQQQNPVVNKEAQLRFKKYPTIFEQLFPNFESPGQPTELLSLYNQYMVDISMNPVSVVYCGSSLQKLDLTHALTNRLFNQFQNIFVCKLLFQAYTQMSCEILKPCTAAKINQQVISYLESLKQQYHPKNNIEVRMLQDWNYNSTIDFKETDNHIEMLAEQLDISKQYLEQKYSAFFTFYESINLEQVEQLVCQQRLYRQTEKTLGSSPSTNSSDTDIVVI